MLKLWPPGLKAAVWLDVETEKYLVCFLHDINSLWRSVTSKIILFLLSAWLIEPLLLKATAGGWRSSYLPTIQSVVCVLITFLYQHITMAFLMWSRTQCVICAKFHFSVNFHFWWYLWWNYCTQCINVCTHTIIVLRRLPIAICIE